MTRLRLPGSGTITIDEEDDIISKHSVRSSECDMKGYLKELQGKNYVTK
jgi:hypothetical protein